MPDFRFKTVGQYVIIEIVIPTGEENKMKQTKKLTIFIFAVLLFVLCGCDTVSYYMSQAVEITGIDDMVEDAITENETLSQVNNALVEGTEDVLLLLSGVPFDESYRQYVDLRDNGELNEKGLYQSEELQELQAAAAVKPDGTVHVSFSVNELIGFNYYLDEAMTEELDPNSCWLNPGDKIYVSEPDYSKAPVLYRFSHFQVRSRVTEAAEWRDAAKVETAPGLVYEIPVDFKGTDISILPMGYYEPRTLILSARDGDHELRGGYWTVNGEEYGNTTVKVDAQKTCEVVYHYEKLKDYYFVSSDPECFYYKDNKDSDQAYIEDDSGTVTFDETPSDKAEVTYTVQLHPYASLLIQNGVEKSLVDKVVSIFSDSDESLFELENVIQEMALNGKRVVNKLTGKEGHLDKLKAGDELRIRVHTDLKMTGSGVTISQPEILPDARVYTVTITDENCTNRNITVMERNTDDSPYRSKRVPNCTLRLTDKYGNVYVDGGDQPGNDEKVKVTIIPNEQVCFRGKHIKDNVYRDEMKYSDFIKNFTKIVNGLEFVSCGSL